MFFNRSSDAAGTGGSRALGGFQTARGSRQTQPYASALACVLIMGVLMVTATLAWGLYTSFTKAGGDSIELMKIDASPVLFDDIAPSRPAPTSDLPLDSVEPVIDTAALLARDAELVKATADQGPALGSVIPTPPVVDDSTPTFNGRPIRPVKTLRMLTTAYSPDAQSCGLSADGITASGYSVWTNGMKMVAADTRLLPFGTILTIPGYHDGRPVPVLDRGGVIKGHRLDVLYPTHEIALQWGAQRLDVTVWEYAD